MSHRIGECSSCGAKYKLPDTFSADKARCKQCDGVVEIGPVVSSEPAPAKTEPKKREGPSMKERLLAERRAETPKRAPAAKSAAKPTARKRPERAAEKPTAKTGVRSSRSSTPARSRRGASGRRRGDDEEEEGSRSRRRPGHAGRKKQQAPVLPFLLAVVALVIVAGGTWYYFQEDEEAAPEKRNPVEVADAGEETMGGAADEGTPGAGGGEAVADTTPEETDPEESTPDEPVAAPKPAVRNDPNSIDLMAIDDFGPIDGCSDERFTELKQLAAEMVDPMAGAAGNRARMSLEEAGKEAFPVILNVMKRLDLEDEDGFRAADVCQRTLQDICNGSNFGWQYPDTSPDSFHYWDKLVIQKWCKTWTTVKDDELKWLKLTKQEDKAAQLEAQRTKEESGATDDELDALDDL